MITKEIIFEEFKIARDRDLKLTKDKEVFKNRIELLKSHKVAAKEHPSQYRNLDINWDNLIIAWSSPNPTDYFYKSVFGLTYGEYVHKKKLEEEAEKNAEKIQKEKDKNAKEVVIN